MTSLPRTPNKPPFRLRDWLYGLEGRHPLLTGSIRRCPCGAIVCRPNREGPGFELVAAPGLRGDVFVWLYHECHEHTGVDLRKMLAGFFLAAFAARADDQAEADRRRLRRLYDAETIAN